MNTTQDQSLFLSRWTWLSKEVISSGASPGFRYVPTRHRVIVNALSPALMLYGGDMIRRNSANQLPANEIPP
jgi:hypothetical protein